MDANRVEIREKFRDSIPIEINIKLLTIWPTYMSVIVRWTRKLFLEKGFKKLRLFRRFITEPII